MYYNMGVRGSGADASASSTVKHGVKTAYSISGRVLPPFPRQVSGAACGRHGGSFPGRQSHHPQSGSRRHCRTDIVADGQSMAWKIAVAAELNCGAGSPHPIDGLPMP